MDHDAQKLLHQAYSLKDSHQSKRLYADWSRTYDKTMLEGLGYLTPKNTANLLAGFLGDKSAAILDVGAGTGLAGMELSHYGYELIDALDYSPEMLEVAKHRNIYRNFFSADLNQNLAIPDNVYDAVICTGTFTHAHVGAGCLDELFRIMKQHAFFACTIHKDVWQSGGFETKVAALKKAGVLEVLHCEMDYYYAKSQAPEGWYMVWQKLGE